MTREAGKRARRRSRSRSVGRPRATAERDDARRQIVAVAGALFAGSGYGATTTARIARAAGLSEGTLFHHFPTKRALLAEVGDAEGERVLAVAFEGADPTAPPPAPEAILRRLFAYARENPDAYRLFAMNGDIEDLASGFSAKQTRVTVGLAAMLERWSGRGYLRPMDPVLVADLIFAVIDTAMRRLVLEERWGEHDAWLGETARVVKSLLFPPAADDALPARAGAAP